MTGLTGSAELHLQQDVESSAASEETDSRERPEQEDRETDRQQWAVGARCLSVWSEDGQVYPATVVSVDGKRCRVRFSGYNNEEDVELSALRKPNAALQTQRQSSQDWKPGSPCRAVYSEDGLVYPAVVLWVKGQRCRVRFDNYNNEEEQDIGALLDPNELHGPCRAAAAKGSSCSGSDCEWRRRSREESQEERGGERRSVWRDEQPSSSWVKEKPGNQSKMETEEKKRGTEKPTNHSSPLFPPFPPPPQFVSGDPVPFIPPPPPPPPPLWMFGKESGSVNATSSMLMLWYMCGFHTGSYMAQQEFRASSKQ